MNARPPQPKPGRKHKVNQDTYGRLFARLLDGPATAHELVEETGLHIVTAQSLMRTLKKHKVVYVSAWEPDALGRDATPVYSLGRSRDRPRRKKSPSQRQREHRERARLRQAQEALCSPL